jgi:mRNA guanylyltransferase
MSLGRTRRCGERIHVPDCARADEVSRLKWKPPSENSIDFKAELRFPPLPNDPSEPDFYAKPTILLNTWLGGQDHEFFDEMEVDDDEWEK